MDFIDQWILWLVLFWKFGGFLYLCYENSTDYVDFKLIAVILRNQLIMIPFFYVGDLALVTFDFPCEGSTFNYILSLSTLSTLFVLSDLCFYMFHRMLHLPTFYHFHKIHHKYNSPFAFSSLYCSSFEMMCNGLTILIPILIVYAANVEAQLCLTPIHYIWIVVVALEPIISHSVALQRFLPKHIQSNHVLHHENSKIYFGSSFGLIDYLMETNKK